MLVLPGQKTMKTLMCLVPVSKFHSSCYLHELSRLVCALPSWKHTIKVLNFRTPENMLKFTTNSNKEAKPEGISSKTLQME